MEDDVADDGILDREIDKLANKIDDNLVVSVDKIDWAQAGNTFKWSVLFKLASG